MSVRSYSYQFASQHYSSLLHKLRDFIENNDSTVFLEMFQILSEMSSSSVYNYQLANNLNNISSYEYELSTQSSPTPPPFDTEQLAPQLSISLETLPPTCNLYASPTIKYLPPPLLNLVSAILGLCVSSRHSETVRTAVSSISSIPENIPIVSLPAHPLGQKITHLAFQCKHQLFCSSFIAEPQFLQETLEEALFDFLPLSSRLFAHPLLLQWLFYYPNDILRTNNTQLSSSINRPHKSTLCGEELCWLQQNQKLSINTEESSSFPLVSALSPEHFQILIQTLAFTSCSDLLQQEPPISSESTSQFSDASQCHSRVISPSLALKQAFEQDLFLPLSHTAITSEYVPDLASFTVGHLLHQYQHTLHQSLLPQLLPLSDISHKTQSVVDIADSIDNTQVTVPICTQIHSAFPLPTHTSLPTTLLPTQLLQNMHPSATSSQCDNSQSIDSIYPAVHHILTQSPDILCDFPWDSDSQPSEHTHQSNSISNSNSVVEVCDFPAEYQTSLLSQFSLGNPGSNISCLFGILTLRLAFNTIEISPREALLALGSCQNDLQDNILRSASAYFVPSCHSNLSQYVLSHINTQFSTISSHLKPWILSLFPSFLHHLPQTLTLQQQQPDILHHYGIKIHNLVFLGPYYASILNSSQSNQNNTNEKTLQHLFAPTMNLVQEMLPPACHIFLNAKFAYVRFVLTLIARHYVDTFISNQLLGKPIGFASPREYHIIFQAVIANSPPRTTDPSSLPPSSQEVTTAATSTTQPSEISDALYNKNIIPLENTTFAVPNPCFDLFAQFTQLTFNIICQLNALSHLYVKCQSSCSEHFEECLVKANIAMFGNTVRSTQHNSSLLNHSTLYPTGDSLWTPASCRTCRIFVSSWRSVAVAIRIYCLTALYCRQVIASVYYTINTCWKSQIASIIKSVPRPLSQLLLGHAPAASEEGHFQLDASLLFLQHALPEELLCLQAQQSHLSIIDACMVLTLRALASMSRS